MVEIKTPDDAQPPTSKLYLHRERVNVWTVENDHEAPSRVAASEDILHLALSVVCG